MPVSAGGGSPAKPPKPKPKPAPANPPAPRAGARGGHGADVAPKDFNAGTASGSSGNQIHGARGVGDTGGTGSAVKDKQAAGVGAYGGSPGDRVGGGKDKGKGGGGGGGGGDIAPIRRRTTKGTSPLPVFGGKTGGRTGGGGGGRDGGGTRADQPPGTQADQPPGIQLDGAGGIRFNGSGNTDTGTGFRPAPAYFDTGGGAGGQSGSSTNPLASSVSSAFTDASLDEVLHGNKKKGRAKRARRTE